MYQGKDILIHEAKATHISKIKEFIHCFPLADRCLTCGKLYFSTQNSPNVITVNLPASLSFPRAKCHMLWNILF